MVDQHIYPEFDPQVVSGLAVRTRLTDHEAFGRWSDWAHLDLRMPQSVARAVGYVGAMVNTMSESRSTPPHSVTQPATVLHELDESLRPKPTLKGTTEVFADVAFGAVGGVLNAGLRLATAAANAKRGSGIATTNTGKVNRGGFLTALGAEKL